MLAALAAILFPARPADAGPWPKGLGQFYVKLDQSAFVSNSFINSRGMVQSGANYLGLTTSLYYEVGLYRGLQIQGLVPYTVATNDYADGTSARRAGPADMRLGLQYALPLHLPLRLATRFELKIPLYDVRAHGSLASLFPALGRGQLDLTGYAIAGASLPWRLYAWAEAGYRFRTEAFVGKGPLDDRSFLDSFVWLAELGWTFYRRMVVAIDFIGVVALGDDQWTKTYITLGPKLYVPVWRRLALEATFSPILLAKNSAPGFSFAFGVSYAR